MDENLRGEVNKQWDEQVSKEKQDAQASRQPYHEPTFTIFLSSLSMQAMIAMGKLESPLTGQKEKAPAQARFLIDTLGIIAEKTKGNLSSEEENLLDEALVNLRMMYVRENNQGGSK